MAARTRFNWNLGSRGSLLLGGRTCIVGIVNLTPDSFSDGGQFASADEAVEHGLRLLDEGADMLDLGAESTRPGAQLTLDPAEEQDRLAPVLTALLHERSQALVSVDTFRAATARFAVELGAAAVNDVSGMQWDSAMAETLATLDCGAILMHARGKPSEWSALPPMPAETIVPTVRQELAATLHTATENGITADRVVLDPGIGFGKRGAENFTLLAGIPSLLSLGRPLMIGLSRKGFLGPKLAPRDRLAATLAANTAAILAGAHLLRVHDVRAAREAGDIADALLAAQA